MGAGSYLELVVQVEEAGNYQLSVAIAAEGPCSLTTAPVVDDAKQADAGYPMKKLLNIEKGQAGELELVSLDSVRFDQAGLHLLRFSSKVDKQLLQIDRIQIKPLD